MANFRGYPRNRQKEENTYYDTPIMQLIIKIEQFEWELAEVKRKLEKLQPFFIKSLTPEKRAAAQSERVKAQNKRLHPPIEKELGNPKANATIPTAEEIQQLLLEDGIKPEDNLGSRAIIEERERRSE